MTDALFAVLASNFRGLADATGTQPLRDPGSPLLGILEAIGRWDGLSEDGKRLILEETGLCARKLARGHSASATVRGWVRGVETILDVYRRL